jgi:hypothetical protein
MPPRLILALILVAAGPLAPFAVWANPPSAIELLFERKHLAALGDGAEITYRFERTVSDTKMLGEPFSDDIKLKVTAAAASGTRDVVLTVFTGERARSLGDLPELTGNPLLVMFLDRAVGNMSQLAGGSRPYLKDRVRASFREKSTVEATTVAHAGKTVEAFRIAVTPFVGDPNAAKMLGYDGAKLTLVVSEAVPGHIVELTSQFESGVQGAPRLDERITFSGLGGKP